MEVECTERIAGLDQMSFKLTITFCTETDSFTFLYVSVGYTWGIYNVVY